MDDPRYKLARLVARGYYADGFEYDDFVQEAYLAMMPLGADATEAELRQAAKRRLYEIYTEAGRERTESLDFEPIDDRAGDDLRPSDDLADAIETWLPSRSAAILRGLYWQGRTVEEVADEVGISESHVHKLKRQALDKLREMMGDSGPVAATVDQVQQVGCRR